MLESKSERKVAYGTGQMEMQWWKDPPCTSLEHRTRLVSIWALLEPSVQRGRSQNWPGIKANRGFPGGSDSKASTCNAADLGLKPGSGRCPGEANGNPVQYSCLKTPMDGGAWGDTVHGVTKSWTWLSDWHFHFSLSRLRVWTCSWDSSTLDGTFWMSP